MMRKSPGFVVTAAFALAVPILTGQSDPADARPRLPLNQCISNHGRCLDRCMAAVLENPFPPSTPNNRIWEYCKSGCDTNHSACVDLSLSSDAAATPPKRKPPTVPRANILEASPGYSSQGPSGIGSPGGAPAAPNGPGLR